MKVSQAVGLAAVVALAATFGNQAAAADQRADNPKFVKLDQDRDGYLSRQEIEKIPGYEKAFREADDDRDGRVNKDEFLKAEANYDRMRAATYASDTVITTKVKAALLKSPGMKSLDVNVETYDGQVLLSGFVRDAGQRAKAIDIASKVEGVKLVKDALLLK
jgi:hyperosmotically inducible protein